MNDLQFENQLLQAEVIALRSELKEAAEKHSTEFEKNGSLTAQLIEMEVHKNRAGVLAEENKKLSLELIQVRKVQAEVEPFKIRIWHLEEELKTLKEIDAQAKIVRLKETIADQDKIVRELAGKFQKACEANEQLKTEVRILTSRLSSPYMRQYRAKWKIVSAGLAICLVLSMFTATYLFFK